MLESGVPVERQVARILTKGKPVWQKVQDQKNVRRWREGPKMKRRSKQQKKVHRRRGGTKPKEGHPRLRDRDICQETRLSKNRRTKFRDDFETSEDAGSSMSSLLEAAVSTDRCDAVDYGPVPRLSKLQQTDAVIQSFGVTTGHRGKLIQRRTKITRRF
ncbi:uncharacterized protein LOC143357204 [Halictus rubicundus]|uniref:uncharacterized protein LOC143357204 n=1 Tax=Halictus rubicundus TaxID=77578 RepID=UPI00403657EB